MVAYLDSLYTNKEISIKMDDNLYIWAFVAAVAAALPVIFIKQYLEYSLSDYWLLLPFVSYSVLIYAYLILLQNNKMSTIYPILKIISILFVIFVGIFINREKITFKNIIGILFGIIAILLLSYK